MSLNSKISANKFSTAEKTMNKYLVFYLGLLFAQVTLATILKYTVAVDRPGTEDELPGMDYMDLILFDLSKLSYSHFTS